MIDNYKDLYSIVNNKYDSSVSFYLCGNQQVDGSYAYYLDTINQYDVHSISKELYYMLYNIHRHPAFNLYDLTNLIIKERTDKLNRIVVSKTLLQK